MALNEKINWQQQWSLYSPGYKNGYSFIQLPNEEEFKLLPGPGFGDYSHPTTHLMMEMIPDYVKNETVFDIGTGSGILAIAAKKWGAKEVYICDIDPDSITHALSNAELNNCSLYSRNPNEISIVLMNMISSEQKIAWSEHKVPFKTLITSGILKSEREGYLHFAHSNGWILEKEYIRDEWMGFIFKEDA